MPPGDVFEPFDLDVVLDKVRDSGGGEGAILVLERALANPPAGPDGRVRDCLDAVVEAYEVAGRQREAIGALGRIAERQPGLRGAVTDTVAGLYARLGEPDAARGNISVRAGQLLFIGRGNPGRRGGRRTGLRTSLRRSMPPHGGEGCWTPRCTPTTRTTGGRFSRRLSRSLSVRAVR